jgi:hypothetical protein
LLKSKLVTERQGLKPTRAFETNVEYTTYTKNKVETIVIIEPRLAMAFHSEYASGKPGIRRGIPASPKKCIGKKQTFTPIKSDQK